MSNADALTNGHELVHGPTSDSGFAMSASDRRAIDDDNWMIAKSVMFCGAATAAVAIFGWMAESILI
ncbi:hypothetical protein [Mycobacteroides chelonae]|jgi:hypothetical protein|uniref:Transmembrane protein n=1 Tax=Mycobacteroides chelonae TaxID=1774 RepID=A0AB73MFX1_MYCCH|nr:hypothetical protein [Mycobacteroides chelonae]MBF9326971.1 hypothetical protein [Mycobacteroides chelonae]MBF9421148.1 hypothetical protein [Mycobacteroides chelonae]MBF9436661.1 hypothetical protein [Mycobacteroides chelonae]MBV6361050.1 hypothetical protein [Mycobacteroides chelonae]MEC4833442.1 hypothetical protein [Mycobacteroides chelonae]